MQNPYIQYYQNQVGGNDYDVFRGTPVQYGYGIGSFFSGLFRKVVPLFTKGFRYMAPKVAQAARTVKPHLLTAAKDLASGVMKDVGQTIGQKIATKFTPRERDAGIVIGDRISSQFGPPEHPQDGYGLRRRRALKRKSCNKNQSLIKSFLQSKKVKKTKSKKKRRKSKNNIF